MTFSDTQVNVIGVPGDSAGTTFCGPTDSIGFYGQVAPQTSGAAQAALATGQGGGVVVTYASTQSPTLVTTITTAEKSMTVQSGTGAAIVPAVGDLFFINKPTSQAGIGVGNIRYSSAGVVGVTFSNFTAATLTPTASEIYGIVMIRGLPSLSATLSPAAVPANTIAEQQFNIVGIKAGSLIQVSKPTSQVGLDIMGMRAVENGVLGITFGNLTAATITPTAAEVYSILTIGNINAQDNTLVAQVNIGTALAAGVATITVAPIAAIPLGNLATTDIVIGVSKDTAQAGLGVAGWRVSSAGNLAIDFVNPTVATLTPTASHVYGVTIYRPSPTAPLLIYSVALNPVAVAADTTAEQTFTVTGLVAGSAVWVNKPSATFGIGLCGARVSAANTLALNFGNVTAASIDPPNETYIVGNFQMPIDTTTGNSWVQNVSPTQYQNKVLLSAIRTAMVGMGQMAGA